MTLIDRLQKATGPDRELDALIGIAAGVNFATPHAYDGSVTYGRIYDEGDISVPSPNSDNYMLVSTYTASIDAALALVERMLPEWDWEVGRYNVTYHSASIWRRGRRDQTQHDGNGVNPSIAILTALFAALQGKDKP